jgi:hypothetical protein
MIIQQRFPWYMGVTAGVGTIGLVTGVGTLAASFQPMFGVWSWGAAVLLDLLALALTVWAVQATRNDEPAIAPRSAAHICVAASVLAQSVTAYQGLSGGVGGWTSAAMHTIPPLVLCLALELIARHYTAQHAQRRAPRRAQETLRVQIAKAATGLPVDLRRCANAVVAAARADVVDVRVLAQLIPSGELEEAPAMRALCAVADPNAVPNAVAIPAADNATDQPEHGEHMAERDRAERRRAVYALRDANMPVRTIATRLGVSTSTVSADLKARQSVGFAATEVAR